MQTIDQLILDENNILFYPMMGNSYQLNDIGNDIVSLLKKHKSKDEIIEDLAQKYNIEKNELFIDVSDFFSKLKIYGLM
ncbi:hypothetical protein MNB_SV-3-1505 [hydrothermal vent metagenome]|uniref:Coenzyme PQQ synthesis protein D (PqqD) n=1 Tax=hydrothermal vent metagenome TaxID=652676 RepID=A0A1W1CE51_9ZZZZ